ncbi:hypothetical protein E4U38_000296 [Claviceps purpurea]|nr:hypothetical protein E4U38_000296 [Claviceps purpurea]
MGSTIICIPILNQTSRTVPLLPHSDLKNAIAKPGKGSEDKIETKARGWTMGTKNDRRLQERERGSRETPSHNIPTPSMLTEDE